MAINQTEEQRKNTFEAAGVALPDAISTQDLTPTGLPTIQPFEEPSIPQIEGLPSVTDQFRATIAPVQEAQQQKTGLEARIEELTGSLGQLPERTAQLEEEAGIAQKRTQVTDLESQLNAIIAQQKAIPLQVQEEFAGRGATRGGVAPIEAGRLRKNAIQALGVSATLQAAQGNLATSLGLIDRAIELEFAPQEFELQRKREQLALVREDLTVAEARRADALEVVLNRQEAQIAEQKKARADINKMAVDAARFGADARAVQDIQNARTIEDATAIASQFLGIPFTEELKTQQFQRSLQEASFQLSVDKFNEDIRQFNEEKAINEHNKALHQAQLEIEKAEKKKEEAKATAIKTEMLTGKLDLIKGLSDHKGLDSRVGPNAITRRSFAIRDAFGAGQEFAGMVHQFIDKETLDMLINVKAQGATFGALQKAELDKLENSASKISFWEIKDDEGNPKGEWNIDEKSFKRELKILTDMTQKALERATGIIPLTPEEQAELDAIVTGGQVDFNNPANFF